MGEMRLLSKALALLWQKNGEKRRGKTGFPARLFFSPQPLLDLFVLSSVTARFGISVYENKTRPSEEGVD